MKYQNYKKRGPKLPAALAVQVDAPRPKPRVKHDAAASKRPTQAKRPAREASPSEPPKKRQKLPELKLPKAAQVGDAEDGEIEWLEYMLRKEGAKDQDGLDDGLDDLLDFADVIGPGGKGLGEDDEEEGDEDEGQSETDNDVDESSSDHSAPADSSSDDEDELPQSTATPSLETPTEPAKYIPPSLRAAALAEKSKGDAGKVAEKIKLERKVQGLLNKLGEPNMDVILGELEALYRDHSRHDVTTTITDLIIQTISDRANLLDSFVILYATIVGALHRIVGIEFGAHFAHTAVMRYHNLITGAISSTLQVPVSTIYETIDESKESMNLLTLIAELFNAQVISARLVYDLIRGFLEDKEGEEEVMGERDVERLLRVIKCSGPQLRSEDPASLKDIVNLVQEKTKGKEKTMTARARFMIETLQNLKAGKNKQNGDAAERMKRFLSGLGKKRRVVTTEPLRISLSDLITADSRGKWWLVGAGWAGNPILDRQAASVKQQKLAPTATQEDVILETARKQGMNTDIRRSIFVVLMTSEDFTHACDRMSLFKLSETQQRECVRVTLHCVGSEKMYNPYYTLVLNHLCATSYAHRFTLQYAMWDWIRMMDGGGEKQARHKVEHTAKALAYIVARGTMDLTMFKAIDFTSLGASSLLFFTTFIRSLVLGTQTPSPLFTLPKSFKKIDPETLDEAFEKSLAHSEVAQGLTYVLQKVKGKMVHEGDSDVVAQTLSQGVKRAKTVLSRAI